MKTRPYWIMMRSWLPSGACASIVEECDAEGWGGGTFSDGSARGNVSVLFRRPDASPLMSSFVEAMRDAVPALARFLRVNADPAAMETVQFSQWRQGDHYGEHCDHDATNRLRVDRKLTVYVSLTDGGGLALREDGLLRCNAGDLLAFSALAQHSAPVQGEGRRVSAVGWFGGPDWR